MPRIAETFKSLLDEMTYGTNLKLVELLHPDNANLTNEDLNTSIEDPQNRRNIQLVLYHTLKSRAKQSGYSQLSYCEWSFGIFDESDWYKSENSVGWEIAIMAWIAFHLQVTATPEFPLLYDWYYQTMWLFSGVPEHAEDDTVMEKHSADAL